MKNESGVRPSPIAGRWYPADSQRLASQVDGYLQAASLPAFNGDVIAVMAPHAGLMYSGPVAGYAFAALKGLQPGLVAVISPLHDYYPQPLLTTTHQAYTTPLGMVDVDHEALELVDKHLQKNLGFGLTPIAYDAEHSLEIELPFLQRVFPQGFKLLPVMVRDPSQQVTRALGEALATVLSARKAVLVASTDLSHFYSQSMAKVLDTEMLRQVEEFNPAGVIEIEDRGRGFACGRGALSAVMWAAQGLGANHTRLLHYATSGDITGDYRQVVGYGAAVFLRSHEAEHQK
jgi:MEMO1 family protein